MQYSTRSFLVVGLLIALILVVALWLPINMTAGLRGAKLTGETAQAALKNKTGASVGDVIFSQRDDGKVVIDVKAHDLPPGFHGFHLHNMAKCDANGDKPFTSAGGHWGPSDQHQPNHNGDLPVLLINKDGTGELTVVTDRFKVADLFMTNGTAVIVHANPDNFANIPTDRYQPAPDKTTLDTGDAGARIACGIVAKGK